MDIIKESAPRSAEPRRTDFLSGGGEMGALIRSYDWTRTPLGAPEKWPQSLKIAARIMLSSSQPFWIGWGPELHYLYNDAYKSIIGARHPWALGKPTAAVWEEIWDEIAPLLAQALTGAEGTYVEKQLLIMERNGYPEETYYTFSYSPVPGEDGSAGGIICANTDDTQRVMGERQLALLRDLAASTANARTREEACEQSAKALRSNPHDLPFAMIYLPAEDDRLLLTGLAGIERGHDATPETLSISAEHPWPIRDVATDHGLRVVTQLDRLFGAALPAGAWPQPPSAAAVLPILPGGETGRAGVVIVGLNPYRLLDSTYRSFLGLVARQIASAIANAQAYEEERRRAEALAEIDRAKTVFFSNVSHEFRTPLTLMLGPLEDILARYANDRTLRALTETAHRNGLRLLKLVNSLLDFARIEAGRIEARYERVDLAGFTADITSSFRSLMEKAGLRLVVDCPALQEPVFIDRDMWEKIVLNLISNAFKFTFAGDVAVVVKPSPDGHTAQMIVRDTGTGIPAHEVPRLFERFHRVEGARGRSFEGSGIGLALVQELVRLHGGTIAVETELGRGSAFAVAIPFGSAHLPADRIGERDTPTAIRAQAYVEEALRWLPHDQPSAVGLDELPSSSAAEDLGQRATASKTGGRILIADDNADMRDYLRRLLTEHGYRVEAVGDGEAAVMAARREKPDLVLSDVMMPGLDGFGVLRELRGCPDLREVPVVLVSARAGEEAEVEGLDAGADDYLVKPFAARELLARIATNLKMARIRREAAEALRARTIELETVLETVPTAVWLTHDRDVTQFWSNREGAQVLRLPAEGDSFFAGSGSRRPDHYRTFRLGEEAAVASLPLQRAARGEEVRGDEIDLRFADGTAVSLLVHATPLRDGNGTIVGGVAAAADITARKQAEAVLRQLNEMLEERVAAEIAEREKAESALRQAQKLEAVGQLTGGVAHDFNNLLHVIHANLELLANQATEGRPVHGDRLLRFVQPALRATERGASLTQQLLAFARRQPLAPEALDLNKLVNSMSELLRRTLGERIAIETVLAGGLWQTFADPNQVVNSVINLAVNARDAMPMGGKLTIETSNAHLDDAYSIVHHDVSPGQYVMIAVSDTGTGMPKQDIERAFEPFFTTKEIGKGTGLGLSQVYGFAKQSDGHVKIYSELGHGTTIRIYLPRHIPANESPTDAPPLHPVVPTARGVETILVIEDDADVRAANVQTLRGLGYRVLEAASGGEALRVLDQNPAIHLLFTDVGLPGGMDGRELADAARQRWPALHVLFTTGYASNAIVHHGRLAPGIDLIVKPYSYAVLATKIRAILSNEA